MASLWRAATGLNEKPNTTDYDGVEFWSNPERTGWLTKQGEYIKTWRRRWFVLKQGKLFWFKDSAVNRFSRTRGVIPVATCLTVKGAEDVLNKQYAFELSTRSETMYFIADSEKEKEDGINSIGRSIVQHSSIRERIQPQPSRWHEQGRRLCSGTPGVRRPGRCCRLCQRRPGDTQPTRGGGLWCLCRSTLCRNRVL